MEYIRLLPKNSLSRFIGRVAKQEKPHFFVENLKAWFVQRYSLNMSEAEKSLEDYPSLDALFTRRLKVGIRPLGKSIVHPCDGRLTTMGEVEEGQLVQTKGITYSLNEFLKDPEADKVFRGGQFFTYYLCPTDYHRVHSPVGGEITSVVHVPGELWPVNPWSVENISQLFAINERVIFNIRTPLGPVALVMIGATNVGDIEVIGEADICTNVARCRSVVRKDFTPSKAVEKGAELGVFHMGSSVVVVYPGEMNQVFPDPGPVRVGEDM